ncbi:enzymatic polyprotein, partial [Trifolium medium]|nr:enzymatic polyprotein [Trifolium medium]
MFASLIMEEKSEVGALPVVCEFLDVFPDDISDLPPEREVEFTIDVIP